MRGKDKKKVLSKYPFCVYCGGTTAAETVDHIPPTGLFPKRDRPPGLFVPSCEDCNRNSRVAEDVASFFAAVRLSPNDRDSQHFEERVRAMVNNHPEILLEAKPTIRQLREAARYSNEKGEPHRALDVRGPLISRMIRLFGAKLGLALHYELKGRALPPNGKVAVMWWTNHNALEEEIPPYVFKHLPEIRTLGKGKRMSDRFFAYNSGGTMDGDSSVHWATFGDAFVFNLFIGENLKSFDSLPSENVLRPGMFRLPLK